MRRSGAVIFDLDDTLYPERQFVHSGLRAVAQWIEERFGYCGERAFVELRLIGRRSNHRVFDTWLAERPQFPADCALEMVECYREHIPKISPFPGMREVLDDLRLRFYLGVISDGYQEVQQRKMASIRLAEYMNAIVYSDEFGRAAWKPSLIPYQKALEQLSVDARDSVYIGDNPRKDFRGARLIGMATIRLRYSAGVYSSISAEHPGDNADVEIRTCEQIHDALEHLGARR